AILIAPDATRPPTRPRPAPRATSAGDMGRSGCKGRARWAPLDILGSGQRAKCESAAALGRLPHRIPELTAPPPRLPHQGVGHLGALVSMVHETLCCLAPR